MKDEAPPPSSGGLWDLIDAVLVINLANRPDRWSRFLEISEGLIPHQKIHRIEAVYGRELEGYGVAPWFQGKPRDPTWGARAGCILSHRKAIQTAVENRWGNVLILEDDLEFDSDFKRLTDHLAYEMEGHKSTWDVLYLGFTDPWGPSKEITQLTEGRTLYQLYGCSCTHAYLLSAKTMEWALKQLPEQREIWKWLSKHRAIDRWYRNTLGRYFKVCCVSPGIISQSSGFSDIVGKETQRHATSSHKTRVSNLSRRARLFNFIYLLKKILSWLNEAYDRLRGLSKKLQGF